jgi:hypothetical protein
MTLMEGCVDGIDEWMDEWKFARMDKWIDE